MKARCWHVETDFVAALGATHDPDLIREIRRAERRRQAAKRPAAEGATPMTAEAAANAEAAGVDDAPVSGTAQNAVHYVDLIHGGQEGIYRRDPVTGKWGRRLDGIDGTGGAGLRLGGPTVDA